MTLLAEQRESWERGERRSVESFLDAHPGLDDEALLDLIYGEVVLREESGEAPSFEEYAGRFGRLSEALRLQFEVHDAFPRAANDETGEAELPQIPGYEVHGLLGRGGMGIVYVARQTSLDRRVALKLLPERSSVDHATLARFHAEARTASSLNHPHIATVLDFGTHEGRPFIVMELVDGRTLAEVIREGPQREDAVSLVRQAAEALATAHEHGIVHRDVKPANLMVRRDGYLKVLDFGLAQVRRPDDQSAPRSIAGTLRYMAPEQLRGEPATPKSDVYALGLVFRELAGNPHPLAKRMAAADVDERPTMAEVIAELRRSRRPRWWLALPLVAALAALFLFYTAFGGGERRADPPKRYSPSIVVLPFAVVGDPSASYLSAGVTEDLTAMLVRAPELTVRSTTAAYAYKGDPNDIVRIGKELDVNYVLAGSVQKADEKLRITARLVDAKTGADLWGDRIDETGPDPWAIQDRISGRIVHALTGELGQLKRAQYREAWGTDSTRMGEYDYYLRGHEFYTRFTPDDNERAGAIWREGLEAFPDSALLAAKLGWHHFVRQNLYLKSDGDGRADYALASTLVRRALAKTHRAPLEDRLAHWLFAYVSAMEQDFDRAQREMQTTLTLSPHDAFTLGDLSTIPIFCAEPQRALDMLKGAIDADPSNADFYEQLRGWALSVGGQYEESETALAKGIELTVVPLLRAVNEEELGRHEEAKKRIADALAKRPDLSQTKWRGANFYRDRAILDRQLADLAAAGLPP